MYDSKKSGAITISHLRFGPGPIRSSYLIQKANFVACHQFGFLERYDMLEYAVPGGTFLLNAPYGEGRGLEAPAAQGAGAGHREEAQGLRDRRLQGRGRDRHGQPHQLGDADLLLRDLRRAAARAGDRADQEGDREDLRQEGRRGRQAQLRRRRRDAREPARGPGRPGRRARSRCGRPCPRPRPDFVQARAGRDHRGQGRPAAGVRLPGRRHLADGHRAVGEARDRARDPGLGRQDLHPVQQVRVRLPPRRDPRQGLRRRPTRRRPRPASSRPTSRAPSSRARSTRSRSRPRTAPAAACA